MKKLRKWLHLLLVICLIAGSILPYLPAMKLTVSAQETDVSGSGEGTTTTVNKFYVDGVGSDDANGLTKDTAFKTLAEAYALIGEDNEKTYIVICENVDASNSGLISYSTIEGANYNNYLMFPVHSGEVVITSKIGEEDYTQDASLSFGSRNDKIYMLQGATTFENINISSHAYSMYANFHNLTLGDGITGDSTYYPARTVYLGFRRAKSGLSYNNDNSKASAFVMDSGKLQKFYAGTHSWKSAYSNMSVTMNGGVIDTLYGTGIDNSGEQSKVEITINRGNVNKCYGVCNQANVVGSGVTITIKKDATVGTVSAVEPANTDKNYVAKLNGPATLNLVGYDLSTAIPGTISDFDYLGLTNSTVQLAATWDGMTGVNMTDDSSLTLLGAVPEAGISVKVQQSGEGWITGTALVTAPVGADSKITLVAAEESEFVGYEFQCESGTENVTWTINSANATYVAQIGEGEGAKQYATLDAAIGAATVGETVTLLANAETGSIDTEKYFILDLKGYTLKVSSFGKYVNVVDSVGGGLLEVAADKCTLPPTNEQMPVYDNTKNGYVFVTIKDQNDGGTVLENRFKLIFRPSFGTDETAKNTLLANGGKAAGISIGLRLYWTEDSGRKSQVLVYGEDKVATVYSPNKKAFYIDAIGTDNFTELKVAPYIESATGVVWNGTPIPVNSAN